MSSNKYISETTNIEQTYNSDKCYMSLVEINDFNPLINNRPLFGQPLKNTIK